jgi:phosphatidylglycerol---prolipoprotein diacylglyceryl transferase
MGLCNDSDMVHNLSPFLWHFWGEVGLRWYGLAYIAGFVFSYFLLQWLVARQKSGLTRELVSDFVTYGAIGILAGGRLGYCLFYDPSLFLKFKSQLPFWGVLAVNEGGMASHGGMLGLMLASFLFAKKHGISLLYLFDLISICGPVGIFFGRLANFINGELVGRPSPEDFPLGVKFPSDIYLWPSQNPSGLGELAKVVEKIPSMSRDTWLTWVDQFRTSSEVQLKINQGLLDIVNAIQSGNEAAREAIGPLLVLRHPSQLYAAAGEGLFLFLLVFFLMRKKFKAGIVGAQFFIAYGIVRTITELYRMPDAHIGFDSFHMTRGQWLSLAMVVVGVVCGILWSRSGSVWIPGWAREKTVKVHRR